MSVTKAEIAEAKLLEAVAEARAATAEAHAAKKDLERVMREAREVIVTDVRAEIAEALREHMTAINTEIPKRMEGLYEHARSNIDLLINLAIGRPGREGDDYRPMLAAKFRQWIGELHALNHVPAVAVLGDGDIPDDFTAKVIPVVGAPTITPPGKRD